VIYTIVIEIKLNNRKLGLYMQVTYLCSTSWEEVYEATININSGLSK